MTGKRYPKRWNKIKFNCKNCGKEKEVPRSQYNGRKHHFCCYACTYKWKNSHREEMWNWKGGISFFPYPEEFNKQLKEKIKCRDSYICQLCGKSESEQILCVHHINYNKRDCGVNNLIVLCRYCNFKVNYNRDFYCSYFTQLLDTYYDN